MAHFFIQYDLRNGKDYKRLYNELERMGASAVLESLWEYLSDSYTVASLRDHLSRFVDADDQMVIAAVQNWATLNVPPGQRSNG